MQDPDQTNEPSSDSTVEEAGPSMVLAEVAPGVAVVLGDVPDALAPGLIEFGLISEADREQLSSALSTVGHTASLGGTLAHALTAQGLYRVSDATQTLLDAGWKLASKDGMNLGSMLPPSGSGFAQARFIPVNMVSTAQLVASVGPALAMVALQVKLTEISGLVRTNIALTTQVLANLRTSEWSQLEGLSQTVRDAVTDAQELGAVPDTLWEKVSGKDGELRTLRTTFREHIRKHVLLIRTPDRRQRREYLESNAEAICRDTTALLTVLDAWVGHRMLHVARARALGVTDPHEQRLVEIILRRTPEKYDAALAEIREVVGALHRELRIVTALPDQGILPIGRKRKDSAASSQLSASALEALDPLARALLARRPELEAPEVVCAPGDLDLGPHLELLRWLLEDGEPLRALAFADRVGAHGPVAVLTGARDKVTSLVDKAPPEMIAVTGTRLLSARSRSFLGTGQIDLEVPLDHVRYVRAGTAGKSGSAVDLITRDENLRWQFHHGLDTARRDGFAAVLAESMQVPEEERTELVKRGASEPAPPALPPSDADEPS